MQQIRCYRARRDLRQHGGMPSFRAPLDRSHAGFSLLELAIVLAAIAMLGGLAMPGLAQLRGEAQLARQQQAVLAALHQARAMAVASGLPAVFCLTATDGRCATGAGDLAAGWRVFIEHRTSSPPRFDPQDQLLSETQLPADVLLQGTRSAVTYWPAARAGTTASFVFCDMRHHAPARAVIVSQTGRTRSSRVAADGTALTCP